MGSFTGGARIAQIAQEVQIAKLRRQQELERQRWERGALGYYDQRLRMFVPTDGGRRVSTAVTQTETKCKCCGSQETRQHNNRTICAYCRSSM
jgi:hypothetical protein